MKLYNIKDHSDQVNFAQAVKQGLGRGQGLFFPDSLVPLANVEALLAGEELPGGEGVADPSCLAMTTESLTREYPLYTPSLLNLVKTSETRARELTGEDRT